MKKIKDFLIKNNFDYFLLPKSDEFFSEYLPQNQKKIEFICGFTGSSVTRPTTLTNRSSRTTPVAT